MSKLDIRAALRRAVRALGTPSLCASLACIAGGLLFGELLLIVIALCSPALTVGEALSGFSYLLCGPLVAGQSHFSMFNLGNMLLKIPPVLMTGLSVAVAFRTGLFNIGAPGQFLVGGATAVVLALSVPVTGEGEAMPVWLLAFVCAMLVGALWGAIPGFFKAWLGVNEVIVCIMTNWIAANAVTWLFDGPLSHLINYDDGKSSFIYKTSVNGVRTPPLDPAGLFPERPPDLGLVIAVLFAVGIYVLLRHTTWGFALRACGHNRTAARYAGMNERRWLLFAMMLSGALAAAGAALWYLGGDIDLRWETYQSLPSDGFDGILVALLAANHPLGVIFGAVLVEWLNAGGFNLAGFTGYNEHIASLIVAVILYFAGFAAWLARHIAARREAAAAKKQKGEVSEHAHPHT